MNSGSEEMVLAILNAIAAQTRKYIPEDTTTLINSENRVTRMGKNGPSGYIQYGYGGGVGRSGTSVSVYAKLVHDGPQKNWKKPGASNRYLQKGIADFRRDDLSRIIAMYQP